MRKRSKLTDDDGQVLELSRKDICSFESAKNVLPVSLREMLDAHSVKNIATSIKPVILHPTQSMDD